MQSLLERLRTLLILGRISNLPTVWSNVLAGWILVEEIEPAPLLLLLLGASCLYVGGIYLNDFCDADFDTRYCPKRPIPAGKISRRIVGILAAVWFAAGLICFLPFNWLTWALALLLAASIVFYDFRHKNVVWAPLVMGFCRFLLYPLAASAVAPCFLLQYVALAGIALGLYVAGITYLARGESRPGKPTRWALLLLLVPVIVSLALCVAFPYPHIQPIFYCSLFLAWLAWLLIPLWRKTNRSVSRVVSGLLAGIVLVDMIAIAPALPFPTASFLPLFILALLLQRIIPAT